VHAAVYPNKIVVTHCARAVYTVRVPVHGTYAAVYTVRHGPYVAVYTARSRPCTPPCTHAYMYTAVTRPCTRHIHGRVHGQYTAVYTGHVHGSVNVRVHGPCARPRTRPVVYMAGRPSGPCTRSQTARYGRVRPVTAVYTARSHPVHDSVYGRVRRPLHGRPTRAYVYTAVKRPCTRHVHVCVHGPRRHVAAVGHVHVRVHDQYTVVYMAGRPTRPCTRAETARYGCGPCTRP